MSVRMQFWLYMAQRVTAVILAPLVLLHLATILYAVDGGLSAGEILARTNGSLTWAAIYGLFVAAAAVHGAIGLRTVVQESFDTHETVAGIVAVGFGLLVLGLGWHAVAILV